MRLFLLLPLIALSACAGSDNAGPSEADLGAVRRVSMSGPSLSWDDLRIHAALKQRACSVTTLVNVDGQVVGYCRAGRECRTMDWRPVAAGCNQAPEYHAGPATPPPAATPRPSAQPDRVLDLAVMR